MIIKHNNKNIFVFSDTHGQHRDVTVPEEADIVICGGDVSIADADIPTDIDILVTHYPPYGILDEGLGSPEILNFVMKSKPAYHLFGHIHATAGQELQFGETLCRNIGICK